MFNIISDMFGYTFLVRAFVVGILVSLCASLLGVSLVMKRFSIVSVICFFTGVIISYMYATPTGASVVFINIIFFALFWLIETLRNFNIFDKYKRNSHA